MRLRRRAGTAAVSKAPMRLATCAARGRWAGWAGYGSGRLSASPYCRTVLGQETTAPAQALGVRTWACWACCPQSEVVEKTGGMVSDSLANDSGTNRPEFGREVCFNNFAAGWKSFLLSLRAPTLRHALSRRSAEAAVREVAARTHARVPPASRPERAHGMQVWPDQVWSRQTEGQRETPSCVELDVPRRVGDGTRRMRACCGSTSSCSLFPRLRSLFRPQ